ncbi:molybdenum cofactor biosynthesis protein MoaE [Nocardioides marmorisolisilvae]|uniref:molybdenum cofactor biosynthesis protein MoaE n=1 Tax=Nocardioides marmorisolisilvae TaxID=1542737 RepID=UPI001FE2F15A|nr:molybdenum cofactor biosynthesis protein MoaE [Nocardioides marmorisolisilvae]
MTSASTGTGNVVRLLDVRDAPLDVAEVIAAVSDPAAGGLNVFVGAVRDHDHGQGVVRLEYSAHPTALDRLAEVAAEVAAEFDAIALAAVHRVGVLGIGDLAVVSAVSAAHRDQAFAASRALIDRLKERVPIWKHQVFTDGTEEWVGTPD